MPGTIAPLAHAALDAAPIAILDLETTGLDVTRDRVVQIGIIRSIGAKQLVAHRIDQLINPGQPIPAVATGIHGIGDDHVRAAPTINAFFPQLTEALDGCVILGHHVAFDIAILRHEAQRVGVHWNEPPTLDLALLTGSLEPTLLDIGLETVAAYFGVKVEGRHTAIGDCQAVSDCLPSLIPKLRATDVRTVGEAQNFQRKRHDLIRREEESGWHHIPGVKRTPVQPAPLLVDSYAFSKRVGDLMSEPPVLTEKESTLHAAATQMLEENVGALLVCDEAQRPIGIITERDLLRITTTAHEDWTRQVVSDVMTTPVETVELHERLYRALGRMDRFGIRHFCVVNAQGAAIGMISQRDLLQHRARAIVVLGDAIADADDVSSLASAYSRVPAVSERLADDGLKGVEIASVISDELRALTGRAAEITRDRLAASGRPSPDVPWCVLVLGSGGRGESLLGADQDNALIYDGPPEHDDWFAELGQGIAELLDASGVPKCQGGVMAANPAWRGNLEEWRDRVSGWLRRARPKDLLNVDIFFDLVPVYGASGLSRTLRVDAIRAASEARPFIALLAESVESLTPRVGLLGRLKVVDGRMDLKRDGLLPLVSVARLIALREGSDARTTPDRLRVASSEGRMSEGDAETLVELHELLLESVLRQQIRDLHDGIRPSSRVEPKALTKRQYQALKEGVSVLDQVLRTVRSSVTGH